ncbi:hypothetical protein FB567DRAFT_21385 [Paraphoma chrysanthemicola]|uniref:Uncharacterized protein n=1 Tax=Paraphoma chrysanthemicola TaxID=798071 RepID=A0A8K0RKQ5_9PLEO|nr:hypothetical protein FB567DRAFT_21385 [Paraphoma chrysanthemicola]
MKETLAERCSADILDDSDDGFEFETPTQAISGRNIDPVKLKILLRTKFGAGSFEVCILQNSYCINAPRKLSSQDVDDDHLIRPNSRRTRQHTSIAAIDHTSIACLNVDQQAIGHISHLLYLTQFSPSFISCICATTLQDLDWIYTSSEAR